MRIIEGDCVERMRELDEASIDAVVCDPPYGLEFMGKEWDAIGNGFRRRDNPADVDREDAFGRTSRTSPEYRAGRAAQEWHHAWATEALRILRPGGHLLAFGGTRTYHRLACAVEDAGFEIRDCIAWIYGSGFPKSLDVSKAIDKAAPRVGMFSGFADHFRQRREATGLGQKDVAKHFPSKNGGLTGCVWNWENAANVPTLAQWDVLAPMLGLSDEWLPLIQRVEAEREKVGERDVPVGHAFAGPTFGGDSLNQRVDETAPATPEAQEWEGWGTSLKPAHEPVVVAQKPTGEADTIRRNLWLLEAQLRSLANDAASGSESRPVELSEAFASAGWTADEQRNTRADLCEAMGTSQFESALTTSLNIVSSWSDTLDELCELTSTSTIATGSGTTTALTTLKSSLSDLTPRTMLQVGMSPDGWRLHASPAVQAFNAVESRLNGTRELLAPAPATSRSQGSFPAEGAPNHEPIVVARKPLAGTVAANVLEHGTGALNVDGCRVGGEVETWPATRSYAPGQRQPGHNGDTQETGEAPAGRWPANLALSHLPECERVGTRRVKGNGGAYPAKIEAGGYGGWTKGVDRPERREIADPDGLETITAYECAPGCPVAELDRQSGERPGMAGGGTHGAGFRSEYVNGERSDSELTPQTYGDTGGASRFFYTAKASRAERNAGLNGGRSSHPTVKPVDLMRWLVRLVCPPGGRILDPFLGSGTTGIAAHLEGFDFIGIEREAEYVAIAEARIKWWSQFPAGTSIEAALGLDAIDRKVAETGQLGFELAE